MKKVLKTAAVFFGVLLILNSILLVIKTNFNFGNVAVFAAGVCFIAFSIKTANKVLNVIRALFYLGVACAVIFCSFLHFYGQNDTSDFTEDAVIVLGAGLKRDEPTLALKERLDKTIEYHQKNPNAVIIVSGAQGTQETVTEAYAMKKYLIKNGIDESIVIEEDKAANTYENFVYSKEITDKIFKGKKYKIAFITNAFHIFRSERLAKNAGYTNVTSLHAGFAAQLIPTAYLRECAAVAKMIVLKR